MIRAKLFESKKIGSKFMTAAEQVEDFINHNSIDKVISTVRIQDEQYEEHSYLKQTYVTELLLIYREGNE